MTTLVPVDRPTSAPPPRPAPTTRAAARTWARSTPGWLRLASLGVAVLIAIAIVVAIGVTNTRRSSSAAARATAGRELIDAQTLRVSLSDADTAAAGSYLTSSAGSPELQTRYQNDMAQAAASLSQVSSQATPAGEQDDRKLLTTDLPIFAGLVETARVNLRQGNPVGAAYLGEANSLMRDDSGLLPAADRLYSATRAKVDAADANATDNRWLWLTIVAFLVALAGLFVLQWRLSRRFRRSINPPMLLATVLVVVAFVWTATALVTQGRAVTQARHQGSDPIATLTEARIQAQALRADDELTLVSRDTNTAYQTDYDKLADALTTTLATSPANDVIATTRQDAASAYAGVADAHRRIRDADTKDGQPDHAIAIAIGAGATDLPQVSDELDRVLKTGVDDRNARFGVVATSATDDLWGLIAGLLLLGTGAIVLVILGARQRLAEYR